MPLIKHNPSDKKKVVKTIKVTKTTTTTTYTPKKNNIKCINYR
jgi:hypothetical protein